MIPDFIDPMLLSDAKAEYGSDWYTWLDGRVADWTVATGEGFTVTLSDGVIWCSGRLDELVRYIRGPRVAAIAAIKFGKHDAYEVAMAAAWRRG